MTDLRKAAEMALDALRLYVTMYPQMDKGYMVDARETLRQALAQTEQEELIQFTDGKWSYVRKPWVGLTLYDITGHMCDCGDDDGTYQTSCFIDYAKAIEQKLKDLNT